VILGGWLAASLRRRRRPALESTEEAYIARDDAVAFGPLLNAGLTLRSPRGGGVTENPSTPRSSTERDRGHLDHQLHRGRCRAGLGAVGRVHAAGDGGPVSSTASSAMERVVVAGAWRASGLPFAAPGCPRAVSAGGMQESIGLAAVTRSRGASGSAALAEVGTVGEPHELVLRGGRTGDCQDSHALGSEVASSARRNPPPRRFDRKALRAPSHTPGDARAVVSATSSPVSSNRTPALTARLGTSWAARRK